MKIAIDTSPLRSGHAGRGIGQYTRLLIDALKTYDTKNEYILNSKSADVTHYPFFDLFFLTLPIIKNNPTIVTIHDVIPIVFKEAYSPGLRGRIKFEIQKLSLSSVTHIVTDSNCSTSDVKQHLKPKAAVSTVYLAPDPTFQPPTKLAVKTVKDFYAINHPYFLYVGDINYNKNLPALLKAFSALNNPCILVLVSQALKRNNPAAAHLWNLIDSLNLEPKLKIINNLKDIETLRALYGGASWYIQPSLYEGFGLPVLEAQACGCPVISSIGGSLLEITNNSAISFDPKKPKALESAIEKAVSANDRSAYIEKGFTNCQRFTWSKTAQEMAAIYETAVK